MSQDAPLSVNDDENELPEHLTQLLREDSRASLPLVRQPIAISDVPAPATAQIASAASTRQPVPQKPPPANAAASTTTTVAARSAHTAMAAKLGSAATSPSPVVVPSRPTQSITRPMAKDPSEIANQTATWNLVSFVLRCYQNSISTDLVGMIAEVHARTSGKDVGGTTAIRQRFDAAMTAMNTRLAELRKQKRIIQYDQSLAMKFLQNQDKIIKDELTNKLGIDLASLEPHLDLDKEMKRRAEATMKRVQAMGAKAKLEESKRAERQAEATKASAAAASVVHGVKEAEIVAAPARALVVQQESATLRESLAMPPPSAAVAPPAAPPPTAKPVPAAMTMVKPQTTPSLAPTTPAPATSTAAPAASQKPKGNYGFEDKNGLLKLPPDKLETAKKEVELVTDGVTLAQEEKLLRKAPSMLSPGHDPSLAWFATNVVDHRVAWCTLRDAGQEGGMRRILAQRPWAKAEAPKDGGKEAASNDVLKLMSMSAQRYLKGLLEGLKVVAWQRQGGLSNELLKDWEYRDRNGRHAGLTLKMPPEKQDPRFLLKKEKEAHRKVCMAREARWHDDIELQLRNAEEIRKKLIRRGTKKMPSGAFKWWEDMEARSRSGWLSMEQTAASEFVKMVAIEHAIGSSAAALKKKMSQQAKKTHDEEESQDIDGASGLSARVKAEKDAAEQSQKESSPLPIPTSNQPQDAGRTPMDVDEQSPDATVVGSKRGRTTDGDDAATTLSSVRQRLTKFEGGSASKRVMVTTADLAELLRGTKPLGNSRTWTRILYKARHNLEGVHNNRGRS